MTTIAFPVEIGRDLWDRRIVLEGVSWETCLRLADEIGDRSTPRMAYWKGILELMSPTSLHEQAIRVLRKIGEFCAETDGIEVVGFGAVRLQKTGLEGFVEPDEAFYVTDAEAVAKRVPLSVQLDLADIRPPDIVIEADVTSPSDKKIDAGGLYAQFGVPEIWHWSADKGFSFLRFSPSDEKYVPSETSLFFPMLTADLVRQAIERGFVDGQLEAVRRFRKAYRSLTDK